MAGFTIPDVPAAGLAAQSYLTHSDVDVLQRGFTGNGVVSGCAVTPHSPNDLSVDVASGQVFYGGLFRSVIAGTVTLSPVSATESRRDVICVDGTTGALTAVVGEFSRYVPSPPDLPTANLIALAVVDVQAGATQITSTMIVDRRVTSVGNDGDGAGKTVSWSRQVGTSPFERWYLSGTHPYNGPSVFGSSTFGSSGQLFVVPYMSGRGGTLDRLAIQCNTTNSNNVYLGIYDIISARDIYPGSLVLDAGPVLVATGIQALTINFSLRPNWLYWFGYWESGTGNSAIWSINASQVPPLGIPDPFVTTAYNLTAGLRSTSSQGLPLTFPAGAVHVNTVPVIATRYSA